MHRETAPTPSVARLAGYVLDRAPGDTASDALAADLVGWLAASPAFRSFVEASRDKIRKKARGALTGSARLDLRAELHVAERLLADRRFDLSYEAYGSGRRGPDFTASYREGRKFNVEVTRRQGAGAEAVIAAPVLAKLRQLPPSAPNVLLIATDAGDAPDPGPVLRTLRLRADRDDQAPFTTLGSEGAAAFRTAIGRLSAVIAWADGAADEAGVAAWANPAARIPLPDATLRALVAALAAEPASRR